MNINSWLEDELYQQYLHDHSSVDESWKGVFEHHPAEANGASAKSPIPVKVIDENRRIINQHRPLVGKSKVSYTHLIGWAIVKALKSQPELNYAYVEKDAQPFRLTRDQINLGIAVDV